MMLFVSIRRAIENSEDNASYNKLYSEFRESLNVHFAYIFFSAVINQLNYLSPNNLYLIADHSGFNLIGLKQISLNYLSKGKICDYLVIRITKTYLTKY